MPSTLSLYWSNVVIWLPLPLSETCMHLGDSIILLACGCLDKEKIHENIAASISHKSQITGQRDAFQTWKYLHALKLWRQAVSLEVVWVMVDNEHVYSVFYFRGITPTLPVFHSWLVHQMLIIPLCGSCYYPFSFYPYLCLCFVFLLIVLPT